MKKIIDNKIYDTENAELVYAIEYTVMEFQVDCCDSLYKTKKGNWFLVEEYPGMPDIDEFNCSVEQNMTIKTSEEAFEWLLENQAVDAIQRHFPDAVEEG